MAKIVLIEDNESFRAGLKLLIESPGKHKVVGQYSSCIEGLRNLKIDNPDLVLIDLELPGMNGIEGIRRILREKPNCTCMIVSVHEDSRMVFDSLMAGASGYITKDFSHEKLLNSIDEILNGGAPMSSQIASLIVKSFQKKKNHLLSERETEVLHLLAKGQTYFTISEQLFISTETVKTHIRNIYQKLHVNNKTEALRIAEKRGLI
jgi:DNA-binding NarL/FixJ family response regulator